MKLTIVVSQFNVNKLKWKI